MASAALEVSVTQTASELLLSWLQKEMGEAPTLAALSAEIALHFSQSGAMTAVGSDLHLAAALLQDASGLQEGAARTLIARDRQALEAAAAKRKADMAAVQELAVGDFLETYQRLRVDPKKNKDQLTHLDTLFEIRIKMRDARPVSPEFQDQKKWLITTLGAAKKTAWDMTCSSLVKATTYAEMIYALQRLEDQADSRQGGDRSLLQEVQRELLLRANQTQPTVVMLRANILEELNRYTSDGILRGKRVRESEHLFHTDVSTAGTIGALIQCIGALNKHSNTSTGWTNELGRTLKKCNQLIVEALPVNSQDPSEAAFQKEKREILSELIKYDFAKRAIGNRKARYAERLYDAMFNIETAVDSAGIEREILALKEENKAPNFSASLDGIVKKMTSISVRAKYAQEFDEPSLKAVGDTYHHFDTKALVEKNLITVGSARGKRSGTFSQFFENYRDVICAYANGLTDPVAQTALKNKILELAARAIPSQRVPLGLPPITMKDKIKLLGEFKAVLQDIVRLPRTTLTSTQHDSFARLQIAGHALEKAIKVQLYTRETALDIFNDKLETLAKEILALKNLPGNQKTSIAQLEQYKDRYCQEIVKALKIPASELSDQAIVKAFLLLDQYGSKHQKNEWAQSIFETPLVLTDITAEKKILHRISALKAIVNHRWTTLRGQHWDGPLKEGDLLTMLSKSLSNLSGTQQNTLELSLCKKRFLQALAVLDDASSVWAEDACNAHASRMTNEDINFYSGGATPSVAAYQELAIEKKRAILSAQQSELRAHQLRIQFAELSKNPVFWKLELTAGQWEEKGKDICRALLPLIEKNNNQAALFLVHNFSELNQHAQLDSGLKATILMSLFDGLGSYGERDNYIAQQVLGEIKRFIEADIPAEAGRKFDTYFANLPEVSLRLTEDQQHYYQTELQKLPDASEKTHYLELIKHKGSEYSVDKKEDLHLESFRRACCALRIALFRQQYPAIFGFHDEYSKIIAVAAAVSPSAPGAAVAPAPLDLLAQAGWGPFEIKARLIKLRAKVSNGKTAGVEALADCAFDDLVRQPLDVSTENLTILVSQVRGDEAAKRARLVEIFERDRWSERVEKMAVVLLLGNKEEGAEYAEKIRALILKVLELGDWKHGEVPPSFVTRFQTLFLNDADFKQVVTSEFTGLQTESEMMVTHQGLLAKTGAPSVPSIAQPPVPPIAQPPVPTLFLLGGGAQAQAQEKASRKALDKLNADLLPQNLSHSPSLRTAKAVLDTKLLRLAEQCTPGSCFSEKCRKEANVVINRIIGDGFVFASPNVESIQHTRDCLEVALGTHDQESLRADIVESVNQAFKSLVARRPFDLQKAKFLASTFSFMDEFKGHLSALNLYEQGTRAQTFSLALNTVAPSDCGIIKMDREPDPGHLDRLPIETSSAYIQVNDRLYYVQKSSKDPVCKLLPPGANDALSRLSLIPVSKFALLTEEKRRQLEDALGVKHKARETGKNPDSAFETLKQISRSLFAQVSPSMGTFAEKNKFYLAWDVLRSSVNGLHDIRDEEIPGLAENLCRLFANAQFGEDDIAGFYDAIIAMPLLRTNLSCCIVGFILSKMPEAHRAHKERVAKALWPSEASGFQNYSGEHGIYFENYVPFLKQTSLEVVAAQDPEKVIAVLGLLDGREQSELKAIIRDGLLLSRTIPQTLCLRCVSVLKDFNSDFANIILGESLQNYLRKAQVEETEVAIYLIKYFSDDSLLEHFGTAFFVSTLKPWLALSGPGPTDLKAVAVSAVVSVLDKRFDTFYMHFPELCGVLSSEQRTTFGGRLIERALRRDNNTKEADITAVYGFLVAEARVGSFDFFKSERVRDLLKSANPIQDTFKRDLFIALRDYIAQDKNATELKALLTVPLGMEILTLINLPSDLSVLVPAPAVASTADASAAAVAVPASRAVPSLVDQLDQFIADAQKAIEYFNHFKQLHPRPVLWNSPEIVRSRDQIEADKQYSSAASPLDALRMAVQNAERDVPMLLTRFYTTDELIDINVAPGTQSDLPQSVSSTQRHKRPKQSALKSEAVVPLLQKVKGIEDVLDRLGEEVWKDHRYVRALSNGALAYLQYLNPDKKSEEQSTGVLALLEGAVQERNDILLYFLKGGQVRSPASVTNEGASSRAGARTRALSVVSSATSASDAPSLFAESPIDILLISIIKSISPGLTEEDYHLYLEANKQRLLQSVLKLKYESLFDDALKSNFPAWSSKNLAAVFISLAHDTYSWSDTERAQADYRVYFSFIAACCNDKTLDDLKDVHIINAFKTKTSIEQREILCALKKTLEKNGEAIDSKKLKFFNTILEKCQVSLTDNSESDFVITTGAALCQAIRNPSSEDAHVLKEAFSKIGHIANTAQELNGIINTLDLSEAGSIRDSRPLYRCFKEIFDRYKIQQDFANTLRVDSALADQEEGLVNQKRFTELPYAKKLAVLRDYLEHIDETKDEFFGSHSNKRNAVATESIRHILQQIGAVHARVSAEVALRDSVFTIQGQVLKIDSSQDDFNTVFAYMFNQVIPESHWTAAVVANVLAGVSGNLNQLCTNYGIHLQIQNLNKSDNSFTSQDYNSSGQAKIVLLQDGDHYRVLIRGAETKIQLRRDFLGMPQFATGAVAAAFPSASGLRSLVAAPSLESAASVPVPVVDTVALAAILSEKKQISDDPLIASIGTVTDHGGAGNCFFLVVAHQIQSLEMSYTAAALRGLGAEYILANMNNPEYRLRFKACTPEEDPETAPNAEERQRRASVLQGINYSPSDLEKRQRAEMCRVAALMRRDGVYADSHMVDAVEKVLDIKLLVVDYNRARSAGEEVAVYTQNETGSSGQIAVLLTKDGSYEHYQAIDVTEQQDRLAAIQAETSARKAAAAALETDRRSVAEAAKAAENAAKAAVAVELKKDPLGKKLLALYPDQDPQKLKAILDNAAHKQALMDTIYKACFEGIFDNLKTSLQAVFNMHPSRADAFSEFMKRNTGQDISVQFKRKSLEEQFRILTAYQGVVIEHKNAWLGKGTESQRAALQAALNAAFQTRGDSLKLDRAPDIVKFKACHVGRVLEALGGKCDTALRVAFDAVPTPAATVAAAAPAGSVASGGDAASAATVLPVSAVAASAATGLDSRRLRGGPDSSSDGGAGTNGGHVASVFGDAAGVGGKGGREDAVAGLFSGRSSPVVG